MQRTSEPEPHACALAQRSDANSKLRLTGGAAFCVLLFGLALGGCYNDPETRMAEIRAIQAGGHFNESIKPLRVLLTVEPDHPEANYRLGVALVQTGRSSLALWPLMKAAGNEEFGTQAGLLLTATLISQESFEEAIRAINRVLEKDPDNLSALYARASALIGAARAAEALVDAEHVLRLKPGDGHAYSIKMASLVDLKRFDEAEASQIELVKITEASTSVDQAARACGVLARFYADQSDNAKSQETHETCLEKYPDHPMVRAWASSFYTITGQTEEAIAIWRGAVDRNPEDFELRATLVDLMIEAEQFDAAEKVMVASAELFDSARAYQKLSNVYRRNNKPTEARVALEDALSRTRNEPDVILYTVGDLFIEEGDLDSADEVANNLKEPSYRHLLKAAILLARNEPADALRKFDEGLRLWPNNARARYLAGVAAQQIGNHERATTEFRESVRVSETETDAALQLARIFYTSGQYATARQFAARHVKNRPLTSPEAHIINSRSALEMGDLKAAFTGLKTLQKTVFAAAAFAEQAAMVRELEGLPEAIQVIEDSNLELASLANTAALRSYVELLFESGREHDAIKAASALLTSNPESTEAMEIKARALVLAGKTSEAQALVDAALEQDPEFAAGLLLKGSLLAKAGDFDAALVYFDRAAAADFDNPNYAYQAAMLALTQGRTDDALARLRKIVQREPGHVAASNDLAWHLAQADSELELALKLAKRATARQPDADTLDTLGWVQYKLDSLDDAIETFNKALELRPDSASIRYRLGVVLHKAGSEQQARAALEQAIGGNAFPELDDAKAELARLEGS